MKRSVAELLGNYRNAKGMSQKELAEIAQLPQSAISDIETGKRQNPGVKTLVAIAAALEISVSVLIGEDSIESA